MSPFGRPDYCDPTRIAHLAHSSHGCSKSEAARCDARSAVSRVMTRRRMSAAPPASAYPTALGRPNRTSANCRWNGLSSLTTPRPVALVPIDNRLPRQAQPGGHDELGPYIDEQRTINDRSNVDRPPLAQHKLIGAGAVPAICQVESRGRPAPPQPRSRGEAPKGLPQRQPPQMRRHGVGPSPGRPCPNDRLDDVDHCAGCFHGASSGLPPWFTSSRFKRGDVRSGDAAARRQLGLRQSRSHSHGQERLGKLHDCIVNDTTFRDNPLGTQRAAPRYSGQAVAQVGGISRLSWRANSAAIGGSSGNAYGVAWNAVASSVRACSVRPAAR